PRSRGLSNPGLSLPRPQLHGLRLDTEDCCCLLRRELPVLPLLAETASSALGATHHPKPSGSGKCHREDGVRVTNHPPGPLHPPRVYFGVPWSPLGASNESRISHSAQCQRRQLIAPGSEPAVTSSFHPLKAATASPFSRSGTWK